MSTPPSSQVNPNAARILRQITNIPVERVVWDDDLTRNIGSFYNPSITIPAARISPRLPQTNLMPQFDESRRREAEIKRKKEADKKLQKEMGLIKKVLHPKKTGETEAQYAKRMKQIKKDMNRL